MKSGAGGKVGIVVEKQESDLCTQENFHIFAGVDEACDSWNSKIN